MKCHACKNEIEDSAKICTHCSSNQNIFIYYFNNVISAGGFLGILLAAITYVTSQLVFYYEDITWVDNLEVVYFNRSGKSVFRNIGDGGVYVSHVNMEFETEGQERNLRWEIGKVLEKNGVLIENAPDTTHVKLFSNILTKSEIVGELKTDDVSAFPRKDRCYWLILRSKDHHDTMRVASFYANKSQDVFLLNGNANVSFISLHKNTKIEIGFEIEGILARNINFPDC